MTPTPSTQWQETIPPDEAARHEALAEQLLALQRQHASGGSVARALHAKGQLGLDATFTVLPDLPPELRQGLFATPGAHRAYVRFSNGNGRRQKDAKPDVRGIGIKVLGVPGKKLIPGLEDKTTQDFLLIRTPAQPFANADDFVYLVRAAETPILLLPKLVARFGLAAFGILKRLLAGLTLPAHSLATNSYYTALPIRFGPYAARLALEPHAPANGRGSTHAPDYLAAELGQRLAAGPVEWDVRVQLYLDDRRTPIEDGSVDWDSPYATVARLTLPPQQPTSPRGQKLAAFVEKLSFDPWHALVEHRPLGNLMRARNAAYRLSTKERAAAAEPDGSETFD